MQNLHKFMKMMLRICKFLPQNSDSPKQNQKHDDDLRGVYRVTMVKCWRAGIRTRTGRFRTWPSNDWNRRCTRSLPRSSRKSSALWYSSSIRTLSASLDRVSNVSRPSLSCLVLSLRSSEVLNWGKGISLWWGPLSSDRQHLSYNCCIIVSTVGWTWWDWSLRSYYSYCDST